MKAILVLIFFALVLIFFMCMRNFDIMRDFIYDYYHNRLMDLDSNRARDTSNEYRHIEVLEALSKLKFEMVENEYERQGEACGTDKADN